jgi:hypothetical protein
MLCAHSGTKPRTLWWIAKAGAAGWPWVRFCLEAHYIQAASVLRRVRESEGIWLAVDEIREREHLHERTLPTLFDATLGLRVRNASHRANVEQFDGNGISNQVATNDLRTLVSLGLLEAAAASPHFKPTPAPASNRSRGFPFIGIWRCLVTRRLVDDARGESI